MSRQGLAVAALLLFIVLFPLAAGASPSHGSPSGPPAALAFATSTPTPTASPFPTATPTFTPIPTATRSPDLPPLPTATPIRAFPFTPLLIAPARESTLAAVGPVVLRWDLPAGATQYQVQVLPANGDGPGLNLIRSAESSYTIPAPVLGQGPYILLPGMRYIWRVRATDKTEFAPENDPAWGQWSEFWAFWTPRPTSAGLAPESPPDGGVLSTAGTQLIWKHSNPALFYYEVQVSGDTRFDPNPATATSFVWWNLVHGGATEPPNSWRTPPLQPGTTYYWRVRPRVQGDGTPAAWGPVWSFSTAATLLTPTPTPSPTATPTPPLRIAFASNRDGNTELYSIGSDGNALIRLTASDQTVDDLPVWSPDGTMIAYRSGDGLTIMSRDGQTKTGITGSVTGKASWSPDSRWVTFVSSGNLYKATTNASDLVKLTNAFHGEDIGAASDPVWSPDGTRIAFVLTKGEDRDLYVINPDRTALTRLAVGVEGQAVWSPDSTRIAYVAFENSVQHIWVVTVQDRTLRQLTSGPADNIAPVWSPDGAKIAFVSLRDFNAEIYVMNADGSGQTRLTMSSAQDEQPAWAPDSRRLAFVSNRDGNSEVYIMNADGSGPRNLSNNAAADARPVWAPK